MLSWWQYGGYRCHCTVHRSLVFSSISSSRALGVPNLHFHDLRHTGNTLAADMGVSLRNLMARMGHDNERAALRYQHQSSNADRTIANGLDALVRAERQDDQDEGDDGAAGVLVPVA
ncbi:tyrosine-type recombinase/integrase [Actinomadura sp. 9N407]|uniref:tyrosine-type recombinase/integrase n=1 Tax=Actinomadura sp. 9N407 TaxID=3375154 RepID=UPI0037AFCA54